MSPYEGNLKHRDIQCLNPQTSKDKAGYDLQFLNRILSPSSPTKEHKLSSVSTVRTVRT
jgi:hypothetical protein